MAQSSRDALASHVSFKEREGSLDKEEDANVHHSKRRVAIKRPPRARNDEGGADRPAPRSSVRRTRTVPAHPSAESSPPLPERRSRRNLSRLFSEEFGDDILLDSSKRIDSSQRSLKKAPSERVLKPTLSKKSGRAATPLDIPFAPSHPGVERTMSAETRFEELLDMEMEAPKTSIRRTRTHVPTSHPEDAARSSSLKRDGSLKLDLDALTRHQRPGPSMTPTNSLKGSAVIEDSAKHLDGPRTSKKGKAIEMISSSSDEAETGEHVVTIEQSFRKKATPPKKGSEKKLSESGASKKSKKAEAKEPEPLTRIQMLLHFLSLIFVQYPFKYHRQWLEKMYRSNRLKRPPNHRPMQDWALNSTASSVGGMRGAPFLPSLPENSSTFTPRTARSRRRTTLDVDDPTDEFGSVLETHHRKRPSRIPRQQSIGGVARPPPGHLPRSHNISIERSQRKKSRRSVEIFGDIMHALGVNTKGGRLKLPFGLSEMDESELSGFQARLYKFIKRQHKGRLARAWDHMAHPLSSMQKKHRRSTNKTRLLNAIDKHRAQKFENGVDMVKTSMFLCGQWVFEALSPPKYTKKPMLFTVLFPLVLILFFGFMAGEYPLWRERKGEKIDYEFGPVELATWLFRAEKWRTFDDGFLIAWGARYLPLVTTESWRWLFSMLVHENFAHLGGNLFLFVILSWSLESKYGFFRTGIICWLSGISGNFISAALEDACGLVLGASGCVFGLAAFYIMDVIGDFKHVSFPCLRLIGICTFLSAFIIALTSHQDASHLSHIGGFLCGMGLSVVLVPRFLDERIEAFLPWISLFSAILLLCVFPLVVLLSVIPSLQCGH